MPSGSVIRRNDNMLHISRKRDIRIWDWIAIIGSLIIFVAYLVPWVQLSYTPGSTITNVSGWDMLLSLNGDRLAEYSYLGLVPTFVFVTALIALINDIVSLYVNNERRDHIDAAIILGVGLLFLIIFMIYGTSLDLFTTGSYERMNPRNVSIHGMFGAVMSLVGIFAAILGNVLNILEDIVLKEKDTKPSVDETE